MKRRVLIPDAMANRGTIALTGLVALAACSSDGISTKDNAAQTRDAGDARRGDVDARASPDASTDEERGDSGVVRGGRDADVTPNDDMREAGQEPSCLGCAMDAGARGASSQDAGCTRDEDGDGVCDDEDTCNGGDDALDHDGDGVCDALDPCPDDNPDDPDEDGVCQSVDNCPDIDNADQEDFDHGGPGDACGPLVVRSSPELTFAARADATPVAPQTLAISNGGLGNLVWHVRSDQPWLHVAPTDGMSTRDIDFVTVTVDPSGLAQGAHLGHLWIEADATPNAPVATAVHLSVVVPEVGSTLSDLSAQLIQLNSCGIPGTSYYRYLATYHDPNGDVTPATFRVFIALDGVEYESDRAFNAVSGDGFHGMVAADNCLAFNGASEGTIGMRIVDTAGNSSNTATVVVQRPPGAM